MASSQAESIHGRQSPPAVSPSAIGTLFKRDARRLVGLILAVGVIVAAVHWPVLNTRMTGFFDDQMYLCENLLVQNPSWATAGRFLSEVTHPSSMPGYYQPLTMISLMVDYGLGGRLDHRLPFHRTSLILHVLNSVFMLILIHQLFGRPWIAAAAALLFGLHPLTVEPIPWIGERGTLLAACFSFCALNLYVRYVRSSGGCGWLAACGLAYLLALMSKPTAILLPLALLAMDFWPLRRLGWRSILEKTPLMALAVLSTAVTMISKANAGSPAILPHRQPPMHTPLVVCHNIIFYLQKIIWPAGLSYHYPAPDPLTLSHPAVLAGVIGTGLLVVLLAVSLRWTRALLAGMAVFFFLIFPTLGAMGFSIVLTSDKYTYLPFAGVSLILAWLLTRAVGDEPSEDRRAGRPPPRKRLALVATIVTGFIIAEAAATRHQWGFWADSVTFSHRMIEIAPKAAVPRHMLGLAWSGVGDLEKGLAAYRQAVELDPHYADAYYDMGNNLFKLNRREEAVEAYRRALDLNPKSADCHANLATTLERLGRFPEALDHYRAAIALNPAKPLQHHHYARCLLAAGQFETAVTEFREYLRHVRQDARAWGRLGTALEQLSRTDEAIQAYRQALQLQPDFAPARQRLAALQPDAATP